MSFENFPRYFPSGITVKELKELVKDWPEENRDGEPTEVWMDTGPGLTSPVTAIWPLNKRELDDGTETADLQLGRS